MTNWKVSVIPILGAVGLAYRSYGSTADAFVTRSSHRHVGSVQQFAKKKPKTSQKRGGNRHGGFGTIPQPAIVDQVQISSWERQMLESTETTIEAERLTALYQEEYDRQQEPAKTGQLVQVSTNPLAFTIDGFIDPETCRRVQNDATGCFDLFFPEQVSDRLFQGQESERDGLLFNTASSQDPSHHNSPWAYPDGLHVDTNNQCLFRHVTCILYLNDVPPECGGATVFPLARTLPDDPALTAARRLLDRRQSHTQSQTIATVGLQPEARCLETRVGGDFLQGETALSIRPQAGRLLIFFSRTADGSQDPRAWHAGERIRPDPKTGARTEKRILTLFKEVDYDGREPFPAETTLEAYLAPQVEEQRQWLQAKARLQQALLSYSTKRT